VCLVALLQHHKVLTPSILLQSPCNKYRCMPIIRQSGNCRLSARRRTHPAYSSIPPSDHSRWFQHSATAKRDRILCSINDANHCEVMESRTESSNEQIDRHWRQWVSFAGEWGLGSDPWLNTVPEDSERLLLGQSFVMYCRTYNFDREGRAHSERTKQMVSTSLRDAVSCVASSFRERSPWWRIDPPQSSSTVSRF
jgi:hypothetical protein